MADAATAIAGGTRLVIEVLGTYDITLVETTPILLEGELWLFEAVHDNLLFIEQLDRETV